MNKMLQARQIGTSMASEGWSLLEVQDFINEYIRGLASKEMMDAYVKQVELDEKFNETKITKRLG